MRPGAIEGQDGAETFMMRSSVRSAGLAILLTMNGCGDLGSTFSSGTGARSPSLKVAEAALQGGSGQIALQVTESVLQKSPDDVHALEIKGDALAQMGDYDDAIPVYQGLLAKDPNSTRATIGMGRIKLTKDPAAAAALFEQVLKRDPKDLTALNNLGIARDLMGRHAEAQTVYREALAANPDLDSAKVNLALSMAMSGQGPAAVQLLKAKATEPGAPVKVKHDYAVVLAMAGNRPEAERVLSENLSPDEVHQLLDTVTGTRTKAPPSQANRFAAQDQRAFDEAIPPDVVQVPEVPAVAMRKGQNASTAALAVPPPMVVRPQQAAETDTDSAIAQPVSPVAAAITNQRPLALPLRASDSQPKPVQAAVANTAADNMIAVPKSVAMPPVQQPPRQAQVEPVTRAAPEPARITAAPVNSVVSASATSVAMLTPRQPAETHVASQSDAAAAPARTAPDGFAPMVQFAAATSEETAHSFWQNLVHKFPDALGQREPTVVRYERGGTVFWRVRTEGFDTVSEAQALCAKMRAGGQNCFVPRS
jgi:Flp pilus assembly protein TadD